MKWQLAIYLLCIIPGTLLARPNVVMVITDDQGYGDLGCHGHPYAITPHMDRLAAESVCMEDYHVAPTCSPTRSALLTGHWTNRTGVWHTINGRSMLRANEITLGQLLKDAGYQTGMFGKWHLGDNYPYRPEDRGFTEVYRHGGGGVGQTPDLWDNAYFDGHYFHNGNIVPADGFCTDVFFEQANRFIEKNAKDQQPFFAYIATNAPHGPLHAPQQYLDMYAGKKEPAFYGMITNIDDNIGKTRQLIADLGIAENTVFIFTTDNGTASGAGIYNAGMRGAKGSEYDGGHRVPFFVHWPAAGMNTHKKINTLSHAVDIVPTLLDICQASAPATLKFDGLSLLELWQQGEKAEFPERYLVTDSQRVVDPIKWRKSAVMSQDWRLINGTELYDMQADPGQKKNVADQHPQRLAEMRRFYEQWWDELEPTFIQTTEIIIGHADHPQVLLTAHDWISAAGESTVPWNQSHIRNAKAQAKIFAGHWAIQVVSSGAYTFHLRRWPAEANQPINAELPAGAQVPGTSKAYRNHLGQNIQADRAVLKIDNKIIDRKPVTADAVEVTFSYSLTPGSYQLAPYFELANGLQLGAYYLEVTKND